MNKKILVTREIPANGVTMLREKGFDVEVCPGEKPPSQKKIISCLKKAPYDGMISLLTDHISKEVFDSAPYLKIVANYAVGFDNIDTVEAKKRNITVTSTPAVSSLSVAEHAVALMLDLTTRTIEGDSYIRKGKFKGWSAMKFIGTDLSNKTIGLIGVGNIGAKVASILHKGFGVSVIYYDLTKNETVENECGAKRIATIEELLKNADIVSLHVPLLDSTRHLINENRLRLMKPTAFLINTSRGAVIDEVALVKALENKVIAGAGLDVFEFEPKLTKGLTKLASVVLTPHIASARESARREMARISAQNIIDFFDGKQLGSKIV